MAGSITGGGAGPMDPPNTTRLSGMALTPSTAENVKAIWNDDKARNYPFSDQVSAKLLHGLRTLNVEPQAPVGKPPANVLAPASLVNQSCPKNNYESLTQSNRTHVSSAGCEAVGRDDHVDHMIVKLAEQKAVLRKQNEAFKNSANDEMAYRKSYGHQSSSNSVPITPATEDFHTTAPTTRPASANAEDNNTVAANDEVLRLKLELAQAHSKISHLEEMTTITSLSQPQSGPISPLEASFSSGADLGGFSAVNPAINQVGMNQGQGIASRDTSSINAWNNPYDDSRSEAASEPLSAAGLNRSRNIWANSGTNGQVTMGIMGNGGGNRMPTGISRGGASFSSGPTVAPVVNVPGYPVPADTPQVPWAVRSGGSGFVESSRTFTPGNTEGQADHLVSEFNNLAIRAPGNRRSSGRFDGRFDSRFDGRFTPQAFTAPYAANNGFNNFGQGPYESAGPAPFSIGAYGNRFHQPAPIGTPLSPLASEFTSTDQNIQVGGSGPWRNEHVATEGATYLPTTEPLNYRRLLDRNATCNWKYIVDKIVCNNDQQASIFLQQKLKVGTPDQKYEIVESIVTQAHPLMVNRFGNFLVQRCFEHGTPEQVIKIADSIRGNTLSLSMDPFGCHVVQKAFDSVPEDYKAMMVHELLRRIPDTVIHRYACHVWQKLFELRWTTTPPQIMKFVNDALRGMWHEVALGETGSLVVQNIFENCLEEDKRPCIEEVLINIDIVAHGQFGNWCIQHICEHGAPPDRSRAIDHVIRYAAEYSMDQYASKVVEKCLKIGGAEFLGRYLDRVCEGCIERPRIPLIDIASDQYGNYLIQWILTHANPQHRELVAAHIRKHMVSLRGSKFGSRVGMLCTNPAITTRPGPGVGTNIPRMSAGARYGRSYQ